MNLDELKGKSVFIVDDNPNNLNVIRDHLTQYGVKAIPLKNGESAIALLEKIQPDIILLDIQMPDGMDGFETCRKMKEIEEYREIPVIFISAFSETVNKVTGFNIGGVDYITKPVEVDELLSRLYVHIKISRLQKELKEANRFLEIKVQERTEELVSVNERLREEIAGHEAAETELRILRDYLTNIIDSMPSMLISIDSDGKVTRCNKTFESISGISAEDALGRYLPDLLPDMAEEMGLIHESILSRKTMHKLKRDTDADVKTRCREMNIYPLISNDETGAVIRIDDVTLKMQMEEMMIQEEKMLSIGGLAAGMSHEIKNPLAGIMQTTDVLANRLGMEADTKANRSAAEEAGTRIENIRKFMESRGIFRMLETLKDSGRRINEIVENMLSFAVISSSVTSSHSIPDILDKSLELAELDYSVKGKYDFREIRIIREYEENLPPVICDRAKIQQVFLNILNNGAQAMQAAGAGDYCFILRVFLEKEEEKIRVEIEDNGPGMDETTRARIFEPFFTTKEPGLGSGLGLSVSYFIITENHGGDLLAESGPGSGAKFIIRLPLKR